jgi:hypothetical protein
MLERLLEVIAKDDLVLSILDDGQQALAARQAQASLPRAEGVGVKRFGSPDQRARIGNYRSPRNLDASPIRAGRPPAIPKRKNHHG